MKIKGARNQIIVEGNLTFDNAEQVKEGLLEKLAKVKTDKEVMMDLSRVEAIDSTGIQLLIAFFKSLENRKIKYKVKSIGDEMLETLELSGLNKFFRVWDMTSGV